MDKQQIKDMIKVYLPIVVGIIVIFITMAVLNGCSGWSKQDIQKEAAWQILHAVDYGQTLDIADSNCTELNPALGLTPHDDSVHIWALGTATFHLLVSHWLKDENRKWWHWATIGLKGAAVINNYSLGLRMRF